MKTYLSRPNEETGRARGGDLVGGRQWHWAGKHRLDATGAFVCGYKSRRTAAEHAKLRHGAPVDRAGLTSGDPRRDPYERKGEVGRQCPQCGRLVTSLMSYEEWVTYQDWRGRNASYGGPRAGYRAWYDVGAHPKPPGRPAWAGKHAGGTGEGFTCLYYTSLRPVLRIDEKDGGCPRCGRLKSEGQPATQGSA